MPESESDKTQLKLLKSSLKTSQDSCFKFKAKATAIGAVMSAAFVQAGNLEHFPTQFKATQLVVAIAVWAIPGGLA